MKTRALLFTLLVLLVETGVLAPAGLAASNGSDNAANYGGSWTNGSNGGTGFGAWDLTNNNNGTVVSGTTRYAGYFLGDSSLGTGNINSTGNVSFGLYAHPHIPGNIDAFAVAYRPFGGGALNVGQTFSIQIGVNYRNGNKGFNLKNGTTNLFTLATYGDKYEVFDAATGNGVLSINYAADSIFNLSFTQTSPAGGTWSFTRTGSDPQGPFTGTYSGAADGFALYVVGTDDSTSAPQNNLYANNMAIVPEPGTGLLLAWAALALIAFVRRTA